MQSPMTVIQSMQARRAEQAKEALLSGRLSIRALFLLLNRWEKAGKTKKGARSATAIRKNLMKI